MLTLIISIIDLVDYHYPVEGIFSWLVFSTKQIPNENPWNETKMMELSIYVEWEASWCDGMTKCGENDKPLPNCHSRGENSANKSRSASWGLFIHFWVAGVAGPDTTSRRRTRAFIRQRAYSSALPQLRQPKSRSPKFITLHHRQSAGNHRL